MPHLPDWCNEEDDVPNSESHDRSRLDDDGNPIDTNGRSQASCNSDTKNKRETTSGKFMEGVPGVIQVVSQPLLGNIQRLVQTLCNWRKRGFPGAQPVSMRLDNMELLTRMPYKLSWKADGTRYMMFIDGKDRIFFADRNHCIYQVENLTFLNRKDPNQHLTQTLLDGVRITNRTKNRGVSVQLNR